jgi:hypothetical protein
MDILETKLHKDFFNSLVVENNIMRVLFGFQFEIPPNNSIREIHR